MKDKHMTEYTNMQYTTDVYNTSGEAWEDLGNWMEANIPERHLLIFRAKPEVNRDYNFDTKRKTYMGFVRFCFNPEEAFEKDSYLKIPSIGEA